MNGELYWAAGFCDGEGSISTSRPERRNVPRTIAEIAQVDREVLDRFASAVGFGNVVGPYKQKNANAQDYYCWRVEGMPHILSLRALLTGKISSVKEAQFNRAVVARHQWERDPQCKVGHSLNTNAVGKYYCPTCSSKNGKANAKPISTHKICGWCKQDKDYEEFNKHFGRLDGRQTVCRACMKAYRDGR